MRWENQRIQHGYLHPSSIFASDIFDASSWREATSTGCIATRNKSEETPLHLPGPVSCELDGCISLQFIERRRTKNRLVLGHADECRELACLLQRKKQQKKRKKKIYNISNNIQKFRKSFWLISSDADWFIIDNKIRLSFPGTAVPISYTNQINTCTSSSIYDTQ